MLLSPFTPLLFMGEEYGETAPFPFFVDHGDPALLEATRQGRRREFIDAAWTGEVARPRRPGDVRVGGAAIPPPATASVLAAYTELLALRRRHPVVHAGDADQSVERVDDAVVVRRSLDGARSVLALNLGASPVELDVEPGLEIVFDSGGAELVAGRLQLPALAAVLLIS